MVPLRPDLPGLGFRPAVPDDTGYAWTLYETAMRARTEALIPWNGHAQYQIVAEEIAGGEAAIVLWAGRRTGWLRLAEEPHRLFLHQIYLEEAFRGRGIGSAVLRAILAAAAERDGTVELSVLHSNPDADRLYRRLGFEEIRRTGVRSFLSCRPGPAQALPVR